MDVRVTGHQVDIGDSLRDQAVGRMQSLAEKYFSRAVAANVTVSPGPHNDFVCDIVAPVANGVVLKAHHRAPEANIAFEGAGDKIETQLRRYAKRLREHKGNGVDAFVETAGYTIFAPVADTERGGGLRPSRDRRRDESGHPRSQRFRRGDAARSSEHECADVQE